MNLILSGKKLCSLFFFSFLAIACISTFAREPETSESSFNRDSMANAVKEAHAENEFNAGETIMHHIKDANEIHFFSIGDHHYTIHLPVIMYSEKGIDMFNSGKLVNEFTHEKQTYTSEKTGIAYLMDEDGHIKAADGTKLYDFSISKNVVGVFIVVGLMFVIFLTVSKAYSQNKNKAPKGLQSFIEPIIVFVRDNIAKPNIGEQSDKYLPFLLSVFFFIWFSNLLGLIPFIGGFNITGNIAVTLVLATFTFLLTNLNAKGAYWKHILMPPIPILLYPIIVPVEILGILTKPFALLIRLFANITAGHIIILSLVSIIFLLKTAFVSIGVIPFLIFMNVLELMVAILQAYIFTLLSSLFIGLAVAESDHH